MSFNMNQDDRSNHNFQNAVSGQISQQIGETVDNAQSPPRFLGPQRKRAPLTSVACQDCRRRKTKCDGKKPACTNCTKRGTSHCTYDLEPNQSRVAAYKQKIEQQIATIHALESEISRLKQPSRSASEGARSSTSESSPTFSNGGGGGVPIEFLMNPVIEPQQTHSSDQGSTQQRMSSSNWPQSLETPPSKRESDLLSHQRTLETENRSLRELVLLLNTVEDRDVAQSMAEEISINGVSDDLLIRAQHLFAAQMKNLRFTILPNGTSSMDSGRLYPATSSDRSRSIP